MLYLKRKIDAFLDEWKANQDRKPLIVKGPRQVGKTESKMCIRDSIISLLAVSRLLFCAVLPYRRLGCSTCI